METESARGRERARLDDQLCFALYAASRAVMGAYRQRLTALGITYPQYLTLLAVWQNDGSTLSQLGRALDLDSGTLSPLIKRLTEMGLLTKERSGPDERTVRVRATESGWHLKKRVEAVRRQVEGSTGLTPDEFTNLRAALHTLRHTVKPVE